MIRRHAARRPARRGAILLIVLTMLALFAVIGLSFVLYSESEATAARIHKDGRNTPSDDLPPDPNAVAGEFLGQLIYPVPDTGDALLSGFRGHELARLMYGYRDGSPNDVAYNGVGLFNESLALPAGALPRPQVLNYSWQFDRITAANSRVVDPEHSLSVRDATAAAAAIPAATVFVGKNAGYTYPDRNNAAVAVVNPNTGEVIVPSFHRPGLFALAPTNPDWTSANGRFKLIRPRPADHSADFPLPPPNPDGTYTGDVQNLIYASGRQKNDSIWIDANLPVVRWRGKNIKPLIAPLVLPLDGRVNLNVAGNQKNAGTAHASNMGFGPWEIDPAAILGSTPNLTTLVNARFNGVGTPPPAGTAPPLTVKLFQADAANYTDPTRQTPPADYARIDFDGVGAAGPLVLPTLMNSQPTYPVPGYESADAAEVTNHPSLWNPFQWPQFPTAPGARQFPFGDLRQTAGRYSDRAGKYGAPVLGQGAFANIFGSGAGSGPFVPTAAADPNRLAAVRRALVTTISNSVSRPGFAPNFGMQATPPTLDLAAGNVGPPALTAVPQFDATAAGAAAWGTAGAWGTDAAANVGRSVRAAFGAVDLNRPLVDYRDPTTRPAAIAPATPWPLNATTVTAAQYDLARADRQAFARDIFNRLVIATGAGATIDATTGPTNGQMTLNAGVVAGTPQFNALRWLAQLAANIVDQIDADDVSTVFVWNPTTPTPATPLLELNAAADYAAGQVNDRVVFGVEKPRLVINETYAEVANAQADAAADPATAKFEVRFFVELLNPGHDITDPANPLYYDQTAPGAVPLRFPAGAGATTSCYKLQIYRNGTAVRTDLASPGNVLGVPPATSLAELKCDVDFLPAGTTDPSAGAALADRVETNNGQFQAGAGVARNGFCVVGPELSQLPADKDPIAFFPNVAAEPFNKMIQRKATAAAGQRMFYTDVAPVPTAAVAPAWPTTLAQLTANVLPYLNTDKHAVLLQRLACPYQPAGPTNPYITVDYTSRVEVHDAVNVTTDMAPSRPGKPTPHTAWSVARVQPLAGDESDVATAADYSTTLTRRTTITNPAPAAGQPPQNSFFRHNSQDSVTAPVAPPGDANLVLPFEWFTHLDRKLVNPVELLHTATVPPHLLTHRFAVPQTPAATRPAFHRHDLQHPAAPVGADPIGALFTANSPAYRLFDGLAVKPWGHALPLGGRVPGKVNINMLWDQDPTTGRSAVFDALFLAGVPAAVPGGNGFTTADLDAIWAGIKATRSPGAFPTVGNTVHETGVLTDDRPFRTPGSPVFDAAGSLLAASDIRDTVFRNRVAADPDTVTRSLFQRSTAVHPYQSWEPLRKAFNNLTTTTDCYLVVFTIGYFEVKNNPPYGLGNTPQLGREVFSAVPGDMRAKYVGVVDRTALGVDNGGNPVPSPWSSELAETIPVGTTLIKFPAAGKVTGPPDKALIAVGGTTVTIEPGSLVRLGTGDAAGGGDGEWVTVPVTPSVVYDAPSGVVTMQVSATTRPHAAGSPVSNIYLKNPGPQPAFNPYDPKWKGVLPFFAKVEPTLP